MIVYEAGPAPVVRAAESVLAGRRLAGRLLPYGAEAAAAARFDPVDRRFVFPRSEPTLRAGPFRTTPWREALSRVPAGPVLVGPSAAAETVWGAERAAAEAAIEAGRPVYLLDPEPAALPSGARGAAVVLCSWRPGRAGAAFPGLERAREAGLVCAALFPLLPGWTAEDEAIEALAAAAEGGGAASLTPLVPCGDGEGRRAIVEARASIEPEAANRFFEAIHHGDWPERLDGRVAAARAAAARRGLALLPPRPAGRGEPAGNALAAARLEERAELLDAGEHRAALLYAAVRWIDESGRDLSAVVREGNFSRIFPFAGEIGEAASAALLGEP